MATSYIPQTDAGFLDWLNNFSALITGDPNTFGLLATDAAAIAAQKTAYQTAYSAATDPGTRTSATVAAKDQAKALALAVVRPYAVRVSLNAGVSDDSKAALGVTIKKTVSTPVPPPTSAPALALNSANIGTVNLSYKDPASPAGKAKPFGVTGVQIFAAEGTVPAIDPSQASYLTTVTKSPFVLGGGSLTSGKIVSLYARWITRSGAGGTSYTGPWSAALVFTAM